MPRKIGDVFFRRKGELGRTPNQGANVECPCRREGRNQHNKEEKINLKKLLRDPCAVVHHCYGIRNLICFPEHMANMTHLTYL